MRLRSGAALACAAVLSATACEAPDGGPATLETDDQKASYAIGLNLGSQLVPAEGRMDMDAFVAGVRDAMAQADPAVDQAELQQALQAFSASIQEEQQREREAAAQRNIEEGEAFLAENAEKEGVTTTASGLQYEVIEEGEGERPDSSDVVSVHYHGTLPDGTVFDSSVERGEPTQFAVGGVIPGFTEALLMMREGSKWRIVIPGDLAYGPMGRGANIGPNQVLVFEMELLEIQ